MSNNLDIGTEENPIRGSSLPGLAKCPGLWLLDMQIDSLGGPAAHTGTAVGRAVELWHRKVPAPEIMDKVKGESTTAKHPFPDARWSEVERMLTSYIEDPRNAAGVVEESLEEEVDLRLDGKFGPIYIRGHLDQVRLRNDGSYEVWDLKAGKPSGVDMLRAYLWQQVAYTLGYSQKYPKRTVSWGGILRVSGYLSRKRRDGRSGPLVTPEPGEHKVFFHAGLRRKDLKAIGADIYRAIIRALYQDDVLTPGDYCRYCPGESITQCRKQVIKLGFSV